MIAKIAPAVFAVLAWSGVIPAIGHAQTAGTKSSPMAVNSALPPPEEILKKKRELEERARKIQQLEQPASPERLAELDAQRRKLEDEKRKLRQLELAIRLTDMALAKIGATGAEALRIESYRLLGRWGRVNGEAALRERPDARAKAVRKVTNGQPVYVLAEIKASGPWLLVVTAPDGSVGFTNRVFVDFPEGKQK